MRLKLLLIVLLTIAGLSSAFAQSQPAVNAVAESDSAKVAVRSGASTFAIADEKDVPKPIFFGDAKMYIGNAIPTELVPGNPATKNDVTMYVAGTMTFADDAIVDVEKTGVLALTGDFISARAVAPADVNHKSLFDETRTTDFGTVRFMGRYNKQTIKLENALGRNKLHNINFPILQVKKDDNKTLAGYDHLTMGLVVADPGVVMSTELLDITNKNRFSAEVISAGLHGATASTANYYKLNSAYVDIKDLKNISGDYGYSQVDMKLYNSTAPATGTVYDAQADSEWKKTNTLTLGTGANAKDLVFMRGFTSPFKELGADYMFYHVLTVPSALSITSFDGPVGPADFKMTAGKGYFYAMDASKAYFDNIFKTNGHTGKAGEFRARGGYTFSRFYHNETASTGYSKFQLNEIAERFNTGDITVDIWGNGENGSAEQEGANGPEYVGGLNFLGNPYMTPISLTGLLGDKSLASDIDLVKNSTNVEPLVGAKGVYYSYNLNKNTIEKFTNLVGPSGNNDDAPILIRPKYWVIGSAFVTQVKNVGGKPLYAYNVKYDAVTHMGVPTYPTYEKKHIEPLQMFAIQSFNSGKFTFTNGLKSLEGEPFEVSIKSNGDLTPPEGITRGISVAEEENSAFPDWFVIEAAVDGKVTSADRTAVRFFAASDISEDYNKGFDEDKIKQKATPAPSTAKSLKSTIGSEALGEMTPENVLYTSTPRSGHKLLSNSVPYGTREIKLHYVPSSAGEENVTLSFFGIENFDEIKTAWLVDQKENVIKEIHDGFEYPFVSSPDDETFEADNRFILRFYDLDDTEEPTITENPITCYYSGSTLHIGGLNEKDLESTVHIFDLQGRLMGNTKINNVPSMAYERPLGLGTFIVKITGARNYNTKFANLYNY